MCWDETFPFILSFHRLFPHAGKETGRGLQCPPFCTFHRLKEEDELLLCFGVQITGEEDGGQGGAMCCGGKGGGMMSTRRGPKWSPFTNWDTGPSNIDVTFAQPVYTTASSLTACSHNPTGMLQVRSGTWESVRRGLRGQGGGRASYVWSDLDLF